MSSLASVEVGGSSYPMVSEPRCRTCQHPRRVDIEREIARGRSPRHFLKELGIADELSNENVFDHVRNQHLPTVAPAVKQVAKERASELQEAAAIGAGRLVGHLRFAQRVIETVQERLESGGIEPTLADGLAAAKLLAASEAAAGSTTTEGWADYVFELYAAANATMESAQWDAFMARMRRWLREHGHQV